MAHSASLDHSAEGDEWLAQLELITERLQLIYKSPLVAHDTVAQTIFRDLALAPDMDEIARLCDLLMARVKELLSEPPSSSYIDDMDADQEISTSRVVLTL